MKLVKNQEEIGFKKYSFQFKKEVKEIFKMMVKGGLNILRRVVDIESNRYILEQDRGF